MFCRVADSEKAAPALSGIVVEVAQATLAYIGDNQSPAVRESACQVGKTYTVALQRLHGAILGSYVLGRRVTGYIGN
jgi:hypothetical protein